MKTCIRVRQNRRDRTNATNSEIKWIEILVMPKQYCADFPFFYSGCEQVTGEDLRGPQQTVKGPPMWRLAGNPMDDRVLVRTALCVLIPSAPHGFTVNTDFVLHSRVL